MSFQEEYAKFTKPSPEREAFVLKTLLSLPREQVVRNMKPITVKKPDGSTITYKVMPDYITVDGMRVPMSGDTAQRVADHFGLSLPSAQMAQDIHNHADVTVAAQPLSGTGTTIGGVRYSPKDVVSNQGVGYAPFAVSYNEKINQQLADKGVNPGGDQIVSGFAKDIIAPPAPGRLGLYGLYDAKGKPIQGGSGETPHDTAVHTEYGSFVRLVSPEVTITYPNGRTETKPVGQVYVAGRYATPKEKPKSDKPQMPSGLEQINQFLDQSMTQVASRIPLYEMVLKYAETNEAASLDPSTVVSPKDYGYSPGVPPPGYEAIGIKGRAPKPIEDTAKQVLTMFLADKSNHPIGSMIPFTVGEKKYMARAEVHSNSPYGISVYQAKTDGSSSTRGRMKLLQRVQNAPDKPQGEIENLFSEIERDI